MSTVMSVTGPISAGELGITSIHEHIFLDLTRHARGPASLLNNQELAYDELMMFKNAGGGTIVDQTTGGLTESDHDILPVKHAVAVRDMAERTGINVILGAGWYREPFYEQRLYRARTDEIAEELVRDVTEGIDSTGVRAGVLGEIGAHFTRVSPAEERVFRAVARAHKETGVTILTHTPNAWSVGLDQLDILEDEGTDLRRIVIGHSHSLPPPRVSRGDRPPGRFRGLRRSAEGEGIRAPATPEPHQADGRRRADRPRAAGIGRLFPPLLRRLRRKRVCLHRVGAQGRAATGRRHGGSVPPDGRRPDPSTTRGGPSQATASAQSRVF